ncbi:hypothetical protein ACFL3G_02380 [Planctomycetota bacterium]
MINFNEDAKKHMDKYLCEVRTCLRDCPSVDADEVEQNIIEHIENEFQGQTEPVSFNQLDAVLKKLGNPTQWVPEEEIAWWRKVVLRLRTGPEDWRLAYISFGLLLLSFCLLALNHRGLEAIFIFPIVAMRQPLSFLLFLASFIISRATLTTAEKNTETLGGQKWLIYPSLILMYAPILLLLLFWHTGALIGTAESLVHWNQTYDNWMKGVGIPHNSTKYYFIWTFIIIALTGLWWSLLSLVTIKWSKLVQIAFYPFASRFNRRKGFLFLLIGIILMVIGTGFVFLYIVMQPNHHPFF